VELNELKCQWNEILFALEAQNRVAWLTFFDARLAKLDNATLTLDFSDPEKFSGDHSYVDAREKFAPMLASVIADKSGVKLDIQW
jgi:hypothetical protein